MFVQFALHGSGARPLFLRPSASLLFLDGVCRQEQIFVALQNDNATMKAEMIQMKQLVDHAKLAGAAAGAGQLVAGAGGKRFAGTGQAVASPHAQQAEASR